MVLAGLFAGVLFLGLILGDWLYFVRFTPDAIRYGCSVARSHDRWPTSTIETVRSLFSANSVLMLPHGIARFYPDVCQIAIRPQYRFFSIGFRSAWPVKGLIHLSAGNQAMDALCVKRIPWSSALMTLLWFGVVLIGSLMFVVTYAWDGGFASLEGMLMGVAARSVPEGQQPVAGGRGRGTRPIPPEGVGVIPCTPAGVPAMGALLRAGCDPSGVGAFLTRIPGVSVPTGVGTSTPG